jgi:hypothetical protein
LYLLYRRLVRCVIRSPTSHYYSGCLGNLTFNYISLHSCLERLRMRPTTGFAVLALLSLGEAGVIRREYDGHVEKRNINRVEQLLGNLGLGNLLGQHTTTSQVIQPTHAPGSPLPPPPPPAPPAQEPPASTPLPIAPSQEPPVAPPSDSAPIPTSASTTLTLSIGPGVGLGPGTSAAGQPPVNQPASSESSVSSANPPASGPPASGPPSNTPEGTPESSPVAAPSSAVPEDAPPAASSPILPTGPVGFVPVIPPTVVTSTIRSTVTVDMPSVVPTAGAPVNENVRAWF